MHQPIHFDHFEPPPLIPKDSNDQEKGEDGGNENSGDASANANANILGGQDSSVGTEQEPSTNSDANVYRNLLRHLGILSIENERKRPPIIDSFDLEGIANLVKSGQAKKIICMCGAGISVSAGIPDFRSPNTGLYHRLESFGLPKPEAVFSIDFFRENPKPFYTLAKELMPGQFKPTPTHYFMTLLHQKGVLLRCFTQNIDSLERLAGLPPELVIPAHGNFDGAHCIECGEEASVDVVKHHAREGTVATCTRCGGYVKPDIVFFGEGLPNRFFKHAQLDFEDCDLLIIMGSSLVVYPFAGLVDHVNENVPRLLINREVVEGGGVMGGLDFGENNYRDALFEGDCDDGVRKLAGLLGWEDDLNALINMPLNTEE